MQVGSRGPTEGMLGGADILRQQVGLADVEHFLFQRLRQSSLNQAGQVSRLP